MSLKTKTTENKNGFQPPPWKRSLQRFFALPLVEVSIGLLVVASVALTVFELWLEPALTSDTAFVDSVFGPLSQRHLDWLTTANDLITVVFVIELSARFFAANSKKRFFSEFWLDILATIPIFRVFRGARALRLLRLVRVVRLLGVMSRLSVHFPSVFRLGAIDFLRICGLLFIAVLFGTIAMMYVEREAHLPNASRGTSTEFTDTETRESPFSMENSFWFSLYTLFAGEPIPNPPKTVLGKTIAVFLMFMGLTIFAIFAGTVSAFMVDRLRVEGRIVQLNELSDHIVICGWTPKTEVIIREYRANKLTKRSPIVVITETDTESFQTSSGRLPNVFFVHDDFTKVSALERAGIHQARTCLVLADTSGGRSEQDADARTILASLTVEKINRDVYTCAELLNRSYASHLDLGNVNEYVISGEYCAHMIAQAGMHRGLIDVLGELLSYQHGNEFYRASIPDSWVGQRFDDKLVEMKKLKNVILVSVHPVDGECVVNPIDYVFQAEDEVVAIGRGQLVLV